MEKTLTYLSGEVVGGIFLYLSLIFVLLFVWGFMIRYSPVVNRRKFTRIVFFLVGMIVLTFVAQRMARPPVPVNQYAAIIPLPADGSGPYAGLTWAASEITTSIMEQGGPAHIHLLRPEWQVDAFQTDSLAYRTFENRADLLSWAKLVRLSYIATVSVSISEKEARLDLSILYVREGTVLDSVRQQISLVRETDVRAALLDFCGLAAKKLLHQMGEKLTDNRVNTSAYDTPSLWSYSRGRLALLSENRPESLPYFEQAIAADSSSAIAYYGAGLAHGELMLRATNDADHQSRQARTEYHLKRANQLNEGFQPSLSALAYYFMFFKPEPRYLDAEIALIAGNLLYAGDYVTYDVLSYMQPIRWETFELSSREQVLEKALEVNPAAFDIYVRLARSYLELSKPHDYRAKKALELFTIAHELRPDDFVAVLGLVQAADYMAQYDRAIKLLERMESMYPQKPDVYYNLGVVTYHLGISMKPKKKKEEELAYYRQAEEYFRKSIELKKDYGYAYLYLAKIYKFTSQRDAAIDALRTAMRVLKPEDRYREEARKTLRDYFPDVED